MIKGDLMGTAESTFNVYDVTTGELLFSEMLGEGTELSKHYVPWDDKIGQQVRTEFVANYDVSALMLVLGYRAIRIACFTRTERVQFKPSWFGRRVA